MRILFASAWALFLVKILAAYPETDRQKNLSLSFEWVPKKKIKLKDTTHTIEKGKRGEVAELSRGT